MSTHIVHKSTHPAPGDTNRVVMRMPLLPRSMLTIEA